MNNSTYEQPLSIVEAYFFVSMIVINACSGVLATILNLLIIITFIKTSSLRTPSNVLILSLAITDFGVGALVQPLWCVVFVTNEPDLVDLDYILFSISVVLCYVSIFTTTAITIDRFLAIRVHLRYQELVTKKRTSMVVLLIWTLSVLLTYLFFLGFDKKTFNVVIKYLIIIVFLSILLINIALMLKISCVIRQHAAKIQIQQQAMNAQPGAAVNIKRSVNIMYYILGTFFLCYFPYISFWIIQYFSKNSDNLITEDVVQTILYKNSSINPILYFWRIQDMRNAALQLLRSIRRNNNNNNDSNNNINNGNSNNGNNNGNGENHIA